MSDAGYGSEDGYGSVAASASGCGSEEESDEGSVDNVGPPPPGHDTGSTYVARVATLQADFKAWCDRVLENDTPRQHASRQLRTEVEARSGKLVVRVWLGSRPYYRSVFGYQLDSRLSLHNTLLTYGVDAALINNTQWKRISRLKVQRKAQPCFLPLLYQPVGARLTPAGSGSKAAVLPGCVLPTSCGMGTMVLAY
jgi:hypothetical protein